MKRSRFLIFFYYLFFSLSLVFILYEILRFRAYIIPLNEEIVLKSFFSFLIVFFTTYVTFKNHRSIDTTKSFISAHYPIVPAIIIIGCIFFLPIFYTGDGGAAFILFAVPSFIVANLFFFSLNIVGFKLKKHFHKNGTIIFLVIVGLLTIAGMKFGFSLFADTDKLYQIFKASKPIQFLYRRNTDIYYVTDKKRGIFKMTPQGETVKISNADIDITRPSDYKFFGDGDAAYFEDGEGWNKMSLVDFTIEGIEHPYHLTSKYRGLSSEEWNLFGEKSKLLIYSSQVIGDGYIYYSTISKPEGLYRINLIKGTPELLVKGEISMFNIVDSFLYYYDLNERRLNSIDLRNYVAENKDIFSVKSTKSAAVLHAEGLTFYNKRNYEESIAVWSEELKIDPHNANTTNNIGLAYRKLGYPEMALKYHNKAIELNSNFGHGYYSQGLAYLDMKNYEQALQSFRKAIELNYDLADSYYNLGLTLYHTDNCDEAIEAFEKSAKIEPSYNKYIASHVMKCKE